MKNAVVKFCLCVSLLAIDYYIVTIFGGFLNPNDAYAFSPKAFLLFVLLNVLLLALILKAGNETVNPVGTKKSITQTKLNFWIVIPGMVGIGAIALLVIGSTAWSCGFSDESCMIVPQTLVAAGIAAVILVFLSVKKS